MHGKNENPFFARLNKLKQVVHLVSSVFKISPRLCASAFLFLWKFSGQFAGILFQAHKHRKVRLSVLLFALSSQSLLNSLQNYLASPIPEMVLVRIWCGIARESCPSIYLYSKIEKKQGQNATFFSFFLKISIISIISIKNGHTFLPRRKHAH